MIWSVWLQRVNDHTLAGNLTVADRACLLALQSFLRCGRRNPTHAAIARRSGLCDRQVRRSLAQARHLHLAWWEAAYEPLTPHRRRQVANRYRLMTPGPVRLGQRRKRQGGPRGPTQRTTGSFFLTDHACARMPAPQRGIEQGEKLARPRYLTAEQLAGARQAASQGLPGMAVHIAAHPS